MLFFFLLPVSKLPHSLFFILLIVLSFLLFAELSLFSLGFLDLYLFSPGFLVFCLFSSGFLDLFLFSPGFLTFANFLSFCWAFYLFHGILSLCQLLSWPIFSLLSWPFTIFSICLLFADLSLFPHFAEQFQNFHILSFSFCW